MLDRFKQFTDDLNVLLKNHKVKLILNIDETVSVIDDNDDHKFFQSIVFKDDLEASINE